MAPFPQNYELTVLSLGAFGLLLLIQLIVSDVVGIRARHVPGTPVPPDHRSLLFRATRAVGNTNESLGIYLALLLFCLLSGASASTVAYLSWGYVATRAAYTGCYYLNLQTLRSVCFGLSVLLLVALLLVGFFS